jgi:poly-gamma-glutamate synthesis protein (capsule biosynthesis protein)
LKLFSHISKNTRKLVIPVSLFLLAALSFIASYKITEYTDSKSVFKQEQTSAPEKINNNEISNPNEEKIDSEETASPKSVEVLLSSVGDCTIGTDEKYSFSGSFLDVFKANNEDYSYFFKNVSNFFKSDDITTANLETTFTNNNLMVDKKFNFKASPEFAKVLTEGYIEGVNIANNHIRDYGEEGFKDTVNTLKANNISYFGEGHKWIREIKGVKFGFLGYKGYSYDKAFLSKLKKDIKELKSQNCIVIINFHWGVEQSYTPNSIQKYLAHYAVDNGADLIAGHHPHVVQGLEKYKGKLIAYSLGNFCFGGNKNPADKDTFILQTSFKFQDQKLVSYGVRVIPCSVSSVQNKNDYSPMPLTDVKKDNFITKINKLSMNLGFRVDDEFYYIDVNN